MISEVKGFIETYELIRSDDRILVAVSGGKDSSALLYILSRLVPHQIEAVTFDSHIPEYSDINRKNLLKFCADLGVKLHIKELREYTGLTLEQVRERIGTHGRVQTYCALCGILKRYYINRFAREAGYTVIATGHNRDDIAQSILMNLMRGNIELTARLGPITGIVDAPGFVRRIKPLYMISEAAIKEFSEEQGFPVHYESCPYSETAYRNTLRDLFWEYDTKHPGAIENTVQGFLALLPKMKDHFRKGVPETCTECGEPARKDICATCSLLAKLK